MGTKASSKADDNIKPSSGSAGGHVRRGSDPTALISAKSCANTSSGTQSSVAQGGSNVSKTRLNPSATAVAAVAASAVSSGPLDQQHPLPLVKGSSLTSKRVATSSTSSDVNREGTNKSSPHGGHRHSADTAAPSHSHHHHHHHHHHAASRRVKNRSRKKKPSRASSSAASMETPNLTEALVGSSPKVPTTHNKHDPPKHQHSAASLLSSVAAASVAMASMDSSSSVASMVSIGSGIIGTTSIPMVPTGTTNSIPPTLSTTTITGPTPTVGAVASATVSTIPTTVSSASLSTKNEPSGTISSGTISADMETKCTQTKLDDELLEPIMGCSASFNSATSCGSEYQKTTITSSNPSTTVEQNPKSISAEPKSGSAGPKSGSVNEPITTTTGISEATAGSNPA